MQMTDEEKTDMKLKNGEAESLWTRTKDDLVRSVERLGFPAELGEAVAKHLGSPKAMERMISYLDYVKPKSEELVVDEMLAIRSEIDAWKEKKASEKANARYNEILYYGLEDFGGHCGSGRCRSDRCDSYTG